MTEQLPCPYLGADVELTDERERHMGERHPELLPRYRQQLAITLADPDEVRVSSRASNARLFARWFDEVIGGKHVVVVVVSDAGKSQTHWILSAYVAQRLAKGEVVEWRRSSGSTTTG